MNRYTFLDYDLKTNEEYLKSIIQNKYKDNEEQFKENQIPKDEPIEDFISCGMGGYIHK